MLSQDQYIIHNNSLLKLQCYNKSLYSNVDDFKFKNNLFETFEGRVYFKRLQNVEREREYTVSLKQVMYIRVQN